MSKDRKRELFHDVKNAGSNISNAVVMIRRKLETDDDTSELKELIDLEVNKLKNLWEELRDLL